MALEEDIKTINASLKDVGDKIKAQAEASEKEIKLHQKMSEETKAKVDELLTAQGALQADLRAAQQQIDKINAGGGTIEPPKSLGQKVVESDKLKAWNDNFQGSVGIRVGSVHAAVDSSSGSAADLIQPQRVPGIVVAPNQRLFVRDLLNFGRTTSNMIEYVRETGFTNNAAPVSENPADVKPESDITFELDNAPIATIAHWIRASKQVLQDVGQLQSYIDGRLMYGLKLKEELQLLKGSGVGLNINGILTQATAYSNPGVFVQAETMLDRLRIAMLQVTLAEYDADAIVINPIDWGTMELTKDQNDNYVWANPRGLVGPNLWGKPVVATQSMDTSDFLVGAFRLGAQGWDREDANITISNQDRDNFVKNMVTILCEERVGLTVFRPEAFVTGSFAGLSS